MAPSASLVLARVNRGLGVCSSGKSNPAGRDAPPGSYDELGTLAATLDRPELVSPAFRKNAASRCSEPVHSLRKAVFLTSLRVRCSHAAAPSIEGQTFKSSYHGRPFSSSAVGPPTRPFRSRRSWGGTHEMRCLERTVRFHFPLTSRSRLPALPRTPPKISNERNEGPG